MKIIAIIPARGGSKGVPRKNIKTISGLPLVAHTIIHALNTNLISRVFVSTEDPEIAEISRKYGAEVIPRPMEIANDKATSTSALLHAVNYLKETEDYEPDLVVFLQATSPLRKPDDIENAIKKLLKDEADSLISTSPFHGFLWRDHNDRFESFSYDYRNRPRRQDAPKDLVENGSIYVLKPWLLKELNNHLGGKITYFEQGLFESFQIDEPDDFILLETLMALKAPGKEIPDLSKIKMVVFDFDGVMTDNRVMIDENGAEFAVCDRGDGWGIGKLKDAGFEAIIISTEVKSIALRRAEKLKIECFHGTEDKLSLLMKLAHEKNLGPGNIAYVGNDENDLSCMAWVGFPVAVANAEKKVLEISRYITSKRGGEGAVREICELFTDTAGN